MRVQVRLCRRVDGHWLAETPLNCASDDMETAAATASLALKNAHIVAAYQLGMSRADIELEVVF